MNSAAREIARERLCRIVDCLRRIREDGDPSEVFLCPTDRQVGLERQAEMAMRVAVDLNRLLLAWRGAAVPHGDGDTFDALAERLGVIPLELARRLSPGFGMGDAYDGFGVSPSFAALPETIASLPEYVASVEAYLARTVTDP